MKILIVDDNEDARMIVRTMLESQDYTVKDSGNSKMAIDFARKWLPDLIISDILMCYSKFRNDRLIIKIQFNFTIK